MPESLKNHDTWGAQVCRVGTRKCTTYQVLSIFTGESGIWCQKPESVVRPYEKGPVPSPSDKAQAVCAAPSNDMCGAAASLESFVASRSLRLDVLILLMFCVGY